MIAYLKGTLTHLEHAFALVEAGGLGYQVFISLNTFDRLQGQSGVVTLHTHHLVKEDAQLLYGFWAAEEKQMFQRLLGVSGVGASMTLMLLSSMGPDDVEEAILEGNSAALKAVKGVGQKTAERIILELKDKLTQQKSSAAASPSPKMPETQGEASSSNLSTREEALAALVTLGIPRAQAETSIRQIMKKESGLSAEELIKKALKR